MKAINGDLTKVANVTKNDVGDEEICPKCGSPDLDFECSEIHDGQIEYPFECMNCHFLGSQWYSLVFNGFTDEDGEDVPPCSKS